MLIPACVVVLWIQSGAINRLVKTDIIPHPSIVEAIGTAAGIGHNPLWMFKVKATSGDIMTFYRKESNRPGWTLSEDNPTMLIFNRDKKRMLISVYENWTATEVTYMLTQGKKID